MAPLKEALAALASLATLLAHALAEQRELALLGGVAHRTEALDGLQAGRVLLPRNNAAALGHHQILLLQATGRVLCGPVVNLCLGAGREFSHLILWAANFARVYKNLMRSRLHQPQVR